MEYSLIKISLKILKDQYAESVLQNVKALQARPKSV